MTVRKQYLLLKHVEIWTYPQTCSYLTIHPFIQTSVMDFGDNSCHYQSRSMVKQRNDLEPFHLSLYFPPGYFYVCPCWNLCVHVRTKLSIKLFCTHNLHTFQCIRTIDKRGLRSILITRYPIFQHDPLVSRTPPGPQPLIKNMASQPFC